MWYGGLKKGGHGYIDRYRKRVFLISFFLFILSISVFLSGFLSTGTKKNYLSIVAVAGILPAAKFVVYFIISCKFKTLTLSEYEKTKESRLHQLYDLFYTTSDMNIMINVCSVSQKKVIVYTKDNKLDKKKAGCLLKENIESELGLREVTVMIYDDLDKYLSELLSQCERDMSLERYLIQASL